MVFSLPKYSERTLEVIFSSFAEASIFFIISSVEIVAFDISLISDTAISPEVIVPVLSTQITSTLARDSIEYIS